MMEVPKEEEVQKSWVVGGNIAMPLDSTFGLKAFVVVAVGIIVTRLTPLVFEAS
jgi:hypothetical protein